jgi:hypothetical protein
MLDVRCPRFDRRLACFLLSVFLFLGFAFCSFCLFLFSLAGQGQSWNCAKGMV